MARTVQIGIVAVVLCAGGCRKSSVAPEAEFSLRLNVVDVHGNPVSGLRVSLADGISSAPTAQGAVTGTLTPTAVTTLRVDAPVSFVGSLKISDLEGRVISDLIDGSLHPGGAYALHWSVPDGLANGVYRCVFRSRDSAGTATLFADSVLVALDQIDPLASVVGWTTAAGVFETGNRLLVPSLLNLGPIPRTDATGPTPLGSFLYLSTVTITLTDTASQKSMVTQTDIADQANVVNLIWNPTGPSKSAEPAQWTPVRVISSVTDSVIIVVPTAWKLYQNYPNPFN